MILSSLLLVNVIIFILALVAEIMTLVVTIKVENLPNIAAPVEVTLPLYVFTVSSTYELASAAGAVIIAVALLVCSGIWLFVKLVLLSICWFVPMKGKRREWLLYGTDETGKIGYIMFFVIFIAVTGLAVGRDFYIVDVFSVLFPSVENNLIFENVTLSIHMAVETHGGVFFHVLGTMLSIGITQHAVSRHFNACYGSAIQRRSQKSFENKFAGSYKFLAFVLTFSVVLLALYIYGLTTNLLTYNYGGFLGGMITSNLQEFSSKPLRGIYLENSSVDFSLVDLGSRFPGLTYNSFTFPVYVLSVLFFYMAIFAPVALCFALSMTWISYVFNFRSRIRRRTLRLTQFFGAW